MSLPNTHTYRLVAHIQAGDRIHRWGDDLLIKSVKTNGRTVYLTVDDEGTEKTWDFKLTDEVICTRRT